MTTATALQTFLVHDQRLISRDRLLGRMVFLPFVYALLVRWTVPWVSSALESHFDLVPYYPLINSYVLVTVLPVVWAMIVGFLFLDDRDDRTLLALQVTPVSLSLFVVYRVSLVWLAGFLSIVLCTPLTGIAPLGVMELMQTGAVASLSGCIVMVGMPLIAQNKVQGFALFKIVGSVVFVPVVGFFVEMPWQALFGLLPFYWGMKLYWMVYANEPGSLLVFGIGSIFQILLLWWIIRRFLQSIHEAV